MTDVLAHVRAQLREHFVQAGISAEPDTASVTFLGSERIDIQRFGPDPEPELADVSHYVSVGCSRHPMLDPSEMVTDTVHGPRAEVVLSLRGPTPAGLVRSVAIVAAAPAVEGLILAPDALVDLETPLWAADPGEHAAGATRPAPFTAFLIGPSDIEDVALPSPLEPVTVLAATPITPTEAAWVRLKGADAMREAWRTDSVDILDPLRPAAQPR